MLCITLFLCLINFIYSGDIEIRPFSDNDCHKLYKILKDPEVMSHSRDGQLDIEGTKRYLKNRILDPFKKQGWGRYALIKKEDDLLIGFCGLTIHTIGNGLEYPYETHVELGYKIGKDYWGNGYATEAAIAIRDYSKDVLKMKYLISIIEPTNKASIRVAEKTGLKFWKKSFFNGEIVHIYRIIFD